MENKRWLPRAEAAFLSRGRIPMPQFAERAAGFALNFANPFATAFFNPHRTVFAQLWPHLKKPQALKEQFA
jgi:hypothetical protein